MNPEGECELIEGTAKRTKGVYLTYQEIRLLELIYNTRYLPASLIHRYINALADNSTSKQIISNRLRRLADMGILFRKSRVLDNNFPQHFYFLKQNGYKVLNYLGVINQGWTETQAKALYNKVGFSMHNVSVLSVLVDLYLEFIHRFGIFHSLKITKGTMHPLFSEWDEVKSAYTIKEGIVPDYVLEYGNKLICFEHDMKTETLKMIQEKNRLYQRFAQKGLNGKKMFVVYGVNESVEEVTELANMKRVHSIMATLSPAHEWAEGLRFYVMSNRYATNLLTDLLLEQQPLDEMNRQALVQESLDALHHFTKKNHGRMENVEKSLLILNKLHSKLWEAVDYAVQIQVPGKAARTLAFITMSYGCVESFQKAQRMYSQIHETNYGNNRNPYTPVELFVGVKEPWGAEGVLLPFQPTIPISAFSTEEWEEQQELMVYTKTSIYKKEREVFMR